MKINNYYSLKSISFNKFWFLSIIFILLIVIIIFLTIVKIYSSITCIGIYQEGYLNISVDINNSDTVINSDYIMIDNKKFDYKILEISSYQVDPINNLNYQIIRIEVKKEFIENEIKEVKFYFHKQRIIEKIWKMFI